MAAEDIIRVVSYTTSSLVLLVGIMVLFNLFLPGSIPGNFRVVLGICMVVYGVYRIFMIWKKQRSEGTWVDNDER
ncbi:MAG: hypothetical protein ABSF91_11280 [Bacteroidota bacterium]